MPTSSKPVFISKLLAAFLLGGISTVSLASLIFSYFSQSHVDLEKLHVARSTLGYDHIKWNPDPSLDSLDAYIEKSKVLRKNSSNDEEFLRSLVGIVAENYKHRELRTHWSQDWIGHSLAASGLPKLEHFDSEVQPEFIARYKYAFCSQVSILIAALLNYHGISYHSIGLSGDFGHFAIAAYANGKGYFLDPNMKPSLPWDGSVIPALLSGGVEALKVTQSMYPTFHAKNVSIAVDNYNQIPAHRILPVRIFLGFLSHWVWAPSLLALTYLLGRRRLR